MRLWKRLLGTALCLCAAVCVMSISASAAEHTDHPICGANHENIGDHTGTCEAVTWTAWNGTDEITYDADTKTAYVYLASDATRNNRLIVKTGCTLYLCLNGNSLTSSVTSSSDTNSEVINVPNNAKFILCDCKDSGTITHSPGAKGKGVRVGTERNPAATFSMYGGTISGNHADAQCWGSGGAGVEIHNGTFKMYGGTISDNYEENTGSNYGGGGVCAHSSGTFTMYGGTINNNHSVTDAGGVTVVGGAMNIYGGTIRNNTAKNYGGGIWTNSNEFKISGNSVIENNTAGVDGGGLCYYASYSYNMTISDSARISGNTATGNGGGICFESKGTLTMNGGSITGNTTNGTGGGVYFKGGAFNISGNLDISGSKKAGADNNVYLPTNKYITIVGALTRSNKIGVTTENKPSTSAYVQIASGNKDYADPDKFLYENDGTIAVSAVVDRYTTQLVACKHNWSGEWQTGTHQHWKECSICKGKNEVSAHTYDQESVKESYKASDANCVSPALYYLSCVCGAKGTDTFTSGETNPDNHADTLSGWQWNEDKHWKEYSCCHAEAEKGEHAWDEGEVTEAATCTAAGEKTYTCTVCNRTKTETVNATGHNWSDAWIHDATHHWHNCKNANCDVTENSGKDGYGPHSGGTATCQAKAVCEICGTAYGETDASNHTGTETWVTTATTHEKKWSCCGAVTVASAEHNWNTPKIAPATCTAAGNKHYTCTECGATKDETLPALGHDPVHHDAKAASCTGIGWDAYDTCSRCDYTTYKEIAALGHDFVNGSYQHDAGKHWKKCSRCDAEDAKAAHNFSQNGRTYTCTDCGYSYTVSSGGGSSTITVPVTGSRDTVKISASVSGGTAEVKEIRQDELDKIGTDSDVVIDLAGLGKSVTGAALPVGTVERISGSQADGALIKLPHAQVRLDRQTLATLAQQASGSKVQLVVETDTKAKSTMTAAQKQALDGMKNAAAIEAYFVSNGQRIYDFNGGQVELTIPYQAGGAIRGWYLKEDGTREQVSAVYDKENARLTLRHFSHYVIEELDSGSAYAACPRDSSCPIAPYTDAAPTAWYHDGVHYCIDNGLMQGVSSTQFLPDGSTTRAQLVTVLWRLEGAPAARGDETFLDAADGAWYTAAVRWAAGEGIVRGYGDGRFGPDDAVTREQMVAILYRFAQYKGADVSVGGDTNILSFADAAAVSEYAVPAMQWACGSGLVAGVAQEGGLALVPKGTTTRAQAATLMMRFQSIFVKNT